MAFLKSSGGPEGFRSLCRLATQLLPDAPVATLRLAEEAAVRARAMEQSSRPWALAQAGELVFRAGKKDAGRKLIEEAAVLVEPLGHDGLDSYARGMVAGRVAFYDAAKARRMIDPIKQSFDFNRWLGYGCVRLAETDLATAKKWLTDLRPDNSLVRYSARQLMAYRLALPNPDEAEKLAVSIEDRSYRALTLAGLAARIGPKDRARVVRLIDAALDPIVADSTGYYANNGGGGGTAALILYRAKEAGHPDLAAVRDRVFGARSAPPDSSYGVGLDPQLRFALALALTDPAAARRILARAVPATEYRNIDGWRERDKFVAVAWIDPEGAVTAVDAVLARAVQAKQGYRLTSLNDLAIALAEPDEPMVTIARCCGLLWDYEEE